jgi:outer membrane receptor for ferrienterochelin and colicins
VTALVVLGGARRAHGEPESVVVTGTRTPETAQRATVRTDVVTREEAERRGATNVAEALASQAGVQVNPGAYGAIGGVSAIQIQGFDRDRVLVLEDGERIVGDLGGAIDLAALPTADLSRIEIVSGPASSLYGTSAIGGVVNVITRGPDARGPSGRLRLEGRTQPGYLAQGTLAYRRASAWVALDANVTSTDARADRVDLPDTTLPAVSRRMVGVRAGMRVLPRVDVRVRARYFDDLTTGLESTLAPGLGRYLVDLPTRTRRITFHVIESLDLGGGSSLRLTLGKQAAFGDATKDRRGSPVDESRLRDHGMQSVEGTLTMADGPRTWVLGSRFEAERFSQDLRKTESRAEGLVTTQEPEVTPLGFGSGALYAQVAWKVGKELTVLAGGRGELHSRYGGVVVPRLSAAYRPSDRWQLRASFGRGFRAPSAKELGFAFDHSFYGYRVIGNSSLGPETSWGGSADAAYAPHETVTLRIAGFANRVQDLIDVDTASGATNGTVTDYRYVNFGDATTLGAQAGAVLKVDERVRAELTYDYLYTRDEANQRPLGGRPPHTLTASLRTVPFWKLEGVARLRVVGDAFVSEALRSPGYTTLDLRVARPLWPSAQAYVGVTNLFDARQEPGRVGDLRPPFGRVFYVGIKAEFPWEEEP